MFKKLILAIALCLGASSAWAQNTTCSDRPTTDTSNACANTRFVHNASNVVPIANYGAKCDGTTDDTFAIQTAWNTAASVGLNVWLGGVGTGVCKISSITEPTPTGMGKSAFLTGPGASITKLNSTVTGTTCAVNISATYGVNDYLNGAYQGFTVQQSALNQTGRGICFTNLAQTTFRDVTVQYFDVGMYTVDNILIGIYESRFFQNNNAIYAAKVANSAPNGWNIIGNHFVNNKKSTLVLPQGSGLINIQNNEFESNGSAGAFATVDYTEQTSFLGAIIGLNYTGNYMEDNRGIEVRIDKNAGPFDSIHNIQNNLFNRSSTSLTGGVLIINTGSGFTTVNVGGNSFNDTAGGTFSWIAAQTAATQNYVFNCSISNRNDRSATMPVACQNAIANAVIVSDSAGQYIGLSTSFPVTSLPVIPTNTILGNATSGSAVATALPIGSCSTAASAVIWTTNTGFGCNTSITAAAVPASGLTGATLAANVLASSLTSVGTLTGGATGAGFTLNFGTSTLSGTIPNANLANSTISGVSLGGTLGVLTFGTHLTSGGSSYNGSAGVTITSDATNTNTASTIVARDGSGNFSAGTIAASLTGHASLDCALTGCTMSGAIAMGTNAITGLTTLAGAGAVTFQSNGSTFAGGISVGQLWFLGSTSLTPAAGSQLTVSQNTGGSPATSAIGNLLGQFISADTAIGTIALDVFANQGVFVARHSGGTQASKTATGATTTFSLSGQGWDTSAYVTGAAIDFAGTGTWSGSNHGMNMRFRTTVDASTTLTERMRLQQGLSVGNTTDPGIGVVSATGGYVANGSIGISTVCTIAVGNVLTFVLGILTAKGGVAGCT